MTQSRSRKRIQQGQMRLELPNSKLIELEFDGGEVCTDGGLLILRKADERLGLCELASSCIGDKRRQDLIKHSLVDLFRQRVYAIAAGYEDCNDASVLRTDAMHRLALGYEPSSGHLLASQPSLSRFESMADATSNKLLQRLLVFSYIKRFKKPPKVVRLSVDTTCDETYGYQQLTFFNGFYKTDCYVPLFVFTEDGYPLAAVLRAGNAAPAEGALRAIRDVVRELRISWPDVRIELTADAAFAVPELLDFCEVQQLTYFIAAKGHNGLTHYSEPIILDCKSEFEAYGLAGPELNKCGKLIDPRAAKLAWRQRQERLRFSSKEEGRMQEHFEEDLLVRKFGDFRYGSRGWKSPRRFICRVDYSLQGADVRYVVTNSTLSSARKIYEEKYCQRAQCENWIKDLKVYMKADRTSCQEFDANQFRVLLHTLAYILMWDVRNSASIGTVTMASVRQMMIKIGVLVREQSRKITLHLASNFLWQGPFRVAWANT